MAVSDAARSPEPRFAGGATIRYIETSALFAALVEGDVNADHAIRGEGERITSALTFAEVRRNICRLGAMGEISVPARRSVLGRLQTLEDRFNQVPVSREILARVGKPFPVEPIRSLDAIHLATAEMLDAAPQMITIVTRDKRVAQNARAMGFVTE